MKIFKKQLRVLINILFFTTLVISFNNCTARIPSMSLNGTSTGSSTGTPSNYNSSERIFPADSGMINIKTAYGAKGDGVTDDTQAIQNAISDLVRFGMGGNIASRIIYFPIGIYLVSNTLTWKDHSGTWQSGLTFQGENREKTIIKLADHQANFQNPSAPADFIITGSLESFDSSGGGFNGFDNYFFDITLDTGVGNPGVTALNYIGNNWCGLERVTIRSSDPSHVGAYGLAMQRYQTGPCLMKNVTIDGFEIGISTSSQDYGVTFEYLTLQNQRLVGMRNDSDVYSIKGLTSYNSVPIFQHLSPLGLLTLIDADLEPPLGTTAISQSPAVLNDNSGTVYARNIKNLGYASFIREPSGSLVGATSVSQYVSGQIYNQFGSRNVSLQLPEEDTPLFEEPNLKNWQSVVALGADPTGKNDSATAIQAAIDSGATTVYFPSGDYLIGSTVFIRGNVRMIEGFDSYVLPAGNNFHGTDPNYPLFQINSKMPDVTFHHFVIGDFSQSYSGVFFQHNSSTALVLRRSGFQSLNEATPTYENTASGVGSLFVEDTYSGAWLIQHPQKVYARQIDPENGGTKITNSGGSLWILGIKTEKGGTTIDTNGGGSTELLGGFLYPLGTAPTDAGFIVTDSHATLVYALTSYVTPDPVNGDGNFHVQVQETQSGVTKNLSESNVPGRGYGSLMPLYCSE